MNAENWKVVNDRQTVGGEEGKWNNSWSRMEAE